MRNPTNGQFKRKPKGVLALIIIMVLIGVGLYFAGEPTSSIKEPVAIYEQEARLAPDVEAYMNSPEFKLEMELKARTDVLVNKRKAEVKLNKDSLATLKTEYETKVLDENDRSRAVLGDIEVELEDIRKQELETGKKQGLKE